MNHECRCFRCHALLARTSSPVQLVAAGAGVRGIEIRCRRCKTAVVLQPHDESPRTHRDTAAPTPLVS